jgi:hypothetical protein
MKTENQDYRKCIFKEENMTSLKDSLGTVAHHSQKKFPPLTRFLAVFALALSLFGIATFISPGTVLAKTATTCGDQVKASSLFLEYSHGNLSDGTLNLVKNTCTGLYHAQVVCTMANAQVDFYISIIYQLGVYKDFNEVSHTCSQVGQVFNTASMAYQQSLYFCAWGSGMNPADGDGGGTNACISSNR